MCGGSCLKYNKERRGFSITHRPAVVIPSPSNRARLEHFRGKGFVLWVQDRQGQSGRDRRKPLKIYVGNLSYDATEQFVRQLFSRHGDVEGVWIINTRVGSPHSHGFVHMPDVPAGERAIAMLDGVEFEGRAITVNKARV